MKRILSYLLCAALLATSLCACNPAAGNDGDNSETKVSEETAPHGIPEELDFNGEDFNICCQEVLQTKLCHAEEYTADNMEAAVYNRSKKTENYLNVNISCTDKVLPMEELRALFQAGDDVYQQYIASGSSYLVEGLLYNVDKLPYINFDAEWWNKEVTDTLRLGKYTYNMVSDYLITNPIATYFNRDLIEDNNLPDPYEMAPAGTWTIDKFIDMAIAVRNDVNGDGDFLGEDDILGIHVEDSYLYMGLPTASARFMSERDSDGRLISNMGNELTYAFLDQIYRLYENPGSALSSKEVQSFENGKALFTFRQISQLEHYATLDSANIGVVPCPKFNEDQTRYYSLDWSSTLAVPSTIKNKELVGAVNEYLAWESGNEVIPTYYEKLLKTRYSADLQTREMVQLIFDTVYLEPGVTYFLFSGFTGPAYICNLPLGGTNAYAAFFRRDKKNIKNALETFYKDLDAIEALEEGTAETETAAEESST